MVNGIEDLEPGFLQVGWDTAYQAATNFERLKMKDLLTQPDVTRVLERFVTDRIANRGLATHDTTSEGRSHFIFEFSFSDGSAVLLRVPYPGGSSISLKAEKIINEGEWMHCFSVKTSIPIPHVYCFSKDASDLLPVLNLPFILMDVVGEGQILSDYLSSLPDSADEIRNKIYDQFAWHYYELRFIALDHIGSVGKASPRSWRVAKRLLTTDMYLGSEGIPHFPQLPFPKGPCQNSLEYFKLIGDQQLMLVRDLRALNVPRRLDNTGKVVEGFRDKDHKIDPEEITKCARLRYRARCGFMDLMDKLSEREDYDNTAVAPFVPNFRPDKMFYNPSTDRITGVFNLEFTNLMPRPFSFDPPQWLVGPPAHYIRRHELDVYIAKYEKALPKFLEAVRNVEMRAQAQMKILPDDKQPLSALMLESWNSKRFWFHYALEHICDVDYLYYTVLYKLHPDGKIFELTPDLEAEMEEYVTHSKAAVEEYERDCKV